LLHHLKPGGRMVLPLASAGEGERGLQRLTVIEAASTGMREQTFDTVRFVPLLSGLG
jgi:protein-L-isoaspartate O-methyltransferase